MTDPELLALLEDLESDRVERTSAANDRRKLRQAICAFANDLPGHGLPGVLFIGVHDNLDCAGLAVTDELLLQLADFRSEGQILPIPSFSVQKRILRGCTLAVLIVEPADFPPVRLEGQVWIRVGPRKGRATPQEEHRLTERRRSRDLPFDLQPLPSARLDDLDLIRFREEYLPYAVSSEVLEENQRSLPEQLQALRFLSVKPDNCPTVLGILVLGRSPRRFLPGAYVQFLRVDGMELSDPIKSQKELDGTLAELLLQIDDVLLAHQSVAADFSSGPTEVKSADYPIPALQQLVRNAVLHRDYQGSHAPIRIYWFSDRIEIHSPGGPYGQVTRANFGSPGLTDYRNPHLAESMKTLGFVQRFGAGIPLAQKELARNGNPPIEFQVEDNFVLVTVRVRSS